MYAIKNNTKHDLSTSMIVFIAIAIGSSATWGIISALANIRVGKTREGIKREFEKDLNNAFRKNGKQDTDNLDNKYGPNN